MVSRWVRRWDSRLFQPILAGLARLRITPNELTLGSLALAIAAGVLFGLRQTGWAVATLVLGGLLDVLDGELARYTSSQSAFGSFLDSVCDHLGDLAVQLFTVPVEQGAVNGIGYQHMLEQVAAIHLTRLG